MKTVKYILLIVLIALIAFLTYRYFYTMSTGPSEKDLEKDKATIDSVVVPDAFDKLNESFDTTAISEPDTRPH